MNLSKNTVPKIGFVTMAMSGYLLGEEMAPAKHEEGLAALRDHGYELCPGSCVYSPEEASALGQLFLKEEVDCVCVMLATFVADYYVTELAKACDKPLFLWALEREVFCLSTVCTPLIAASLKNLEKDCCVVSGDTEDGFVYKKLFSYSHAAMLKNRMRGKRIGYIGHKPSIMYSMESDEFMLDRKFGVTLKTIPTEDFYRKAGQISETQIKEKWKEISEKAGVIKVREKDALESVRYYLAAKRQIEENGLLGYSINCFPRLKARICLAVALLNDDGIGAGCEGDINSTIWMTAASMLTGKAAFNGDFLRVYGEQNSILFSHCGAGAFSLAKDKKDICLKCSAETDDGLAVFYKTEPRGKMTLVNMVLGIQNMRVSVLSGHMREDCSGYEGTPTLIRFDGDVRDMPDKLAQRGAGHHWVGIQGEWANTIGLLARMVKLDYEHLKADKI